MDLKLLNDLTTSSRQILKSSEFEFDREVDLAVDLGVELGLKLVFSYNLHILATIFTITLDNVSISYLVYML